MPTRQEYFENVCLPVWNQALVMGEDLPMESIQQFLDALVTAGKVEDGPCDFTPYR